MPSISGILETALYVADPQLAAEFYCRVFGFDPLVETDRLVALDVAGRSVLLLFKRNATDRPFETPGGVIPGHGASGRSHFALSIDADQVDAWRRQLTDAGVAIESEVTWRGGALSIYFRDPDGHLGELITPGFWRIY
jgi:catechol 2,3-dioxygenase-like lactoylglutathione lyase family enzyme